MNQPALIRIEKLNKSYGGVRALQDVDLEVAPGEVHAICGENGAGKSTLIKVLTGVTRPDSGAIFIHGQPLECGSVAHSEAAGIAVMHQESTVFPDLNALDNIYVGREPTRLAGWLLDHRTMRRGTHAILERLGEQLDVTVPVRELSVAQRQIVAMARALSRNCRLLIMDEPTASLSARESSTLLNIIRQLRQDGVGVLYVSHRLEEIFAIADRVTVLRDGARVGTYATSEVDPARLIQLMVGREVQLGRRRGAGSFDEREMVLQVEQLTRSGAFADVSFNIRAGEVVGLGGLIGAGRSEIARAIFGVDTYDSGCVRISNHVLPRGSVSASMAAGIALVPEDRQHEGLVLPMTAGENLSLAVLARLRRGPFLQFARERELVKRQIDRLQIRAGGAHVPAATLSGGNQQKLVLGKWLASQPQLLILDEPTRGVDVGAKAQVHQFIRDLADQGVATLIISSELPELLALSDRILVLRQGRIVGEFNGPSTTQEQVLALALPDGPEVAPP